MKNIGVIGITEIYKLVLSGKLKRFPNYTWSESDKLENASRCTRYMIESVLKWDKEDVKKNIMVKVFNQNKLSGMMSHVFNNSPFAALENAYPGKYKPWELSMAPLRIWDEETGVTAFKWLVEEKLKWTQGDLLENLTLEVLTNNGLGGMHQVSFSGSIRKLIEKSYNPCKRKPLLHQWEGMNFVCFKLIFPFCD